MSGYQDSGADISPGGLYRYRLWRTWGPGPRVLWVMLNPSTADETVNDPTIERLERRARQSGYCALGVINLFAWRATIHANLEAWTIPLGPTMTAS